MKLRKWNYENHDYEPLIIPDDWNCKTYSTDMDELVTCPHCGSCIPYGCTYTSMEIHTEVGFGYCVCENCCNEEWERRGKYRDD